MIGYYEFKNVVITFIIIAYVNNNIIDKMRVEGIIESVHKI